MIVEGQDTVSVLPREQVIVSVPRKEWEEMELSEEDEEEIV